MIELILVMIIIAILAYALIGNYMSALKKGRDARRKNDLSQISKALEMYYGDNNQYPVLPSSQLFGQKFAIPVGCNATLCDKVYMTRTGSDPVSQYTYVYEYENSTTPQYYYLYSFIEDAEDQGSNVSTGGFANYSAGSKADCGVDNPAPCRFYLPSANAPPLTPNPTPAP